MDPIDSIENPEEELKKINKVITQYTLVLKTTTDAAQQKRVKQKLVSLREYREKLIQVCEPLKAQDEESAPSEPKQPPLKYLGYIVREGIERPIRDQEVNRLSLYLKFFDRELLVVFSERKMRLDFQHSLERDTFYLRFQEAQRKLTDFEEELKRSEEEESKIEDKLERKRRISKMKRALTVEANRFFTAILTFASELVTDIAEDGLKCLNGNGTIHLDEIERKSYLEGKTVKEALEIIQEFSLEVIDFLNVPDFNIQEQ